MDAIILAVATFHSLGLSWAPAAGGADVACAVRYRAEGEADWHEGHPLWFDARDDEYRGSLVGLRPGTTYAVEVSLEDGTTQTVDASTWSETFPVARTVDVGSRTDPLEITEGGTADGYVVYDGASIDLASNEDDDAVVVRASYVILRHATIVGGRHAIVLDGAHDVVIEESDVSGWGRVEADGFAALQSGVFCRNDLSVERVIVQRNRFHHPRYDSNSWGEYRDMFGTAHPRGANAVTFETCGGNHVFRYNEVYSDADHYFMDGIGGGENFSDEGFPRADSDIYGNRISECWDDGIEAEGANENVRVFRNFTERTYVSIASATTSVGPEYVFRNVMGETQYDPSMPRDDDDHGPFLKAGGRDSFYGGRIYVFHNTTLQPMDPAGTATRGLGAGGGILDSGAPLLEQVVSRNNVFFIHKDWWDVIHDGRASDTNDFDWDLYNGQISAYAGAEPNGIEGEPVFAGAAPELDASSPGYDEAAALPGFNDVFVGAGPDMGAAEAGGPPLEWGVDADRDTDPMPGTDGGVTAGDGGGAPGTDGGPGGREDAGPGSGAAGGDGGGCGCTVTAGRSSPPPAGWLVLGAFTAAIVRSRRPRRSDSSRCS